MPSAWAKFGRRSVPVERQFPEMSQGKLVPFNEEEGRNRRPISLGPSRMLVDALTGPLGAVAQMAGAWAKLPGDESKEPVGQAAVPKWLLMALSAPKDMDAITKEAYQQSLIGRARQETRIKKPSTYLNDEINRDRTFFPVSAATESAETGGILKNRQPRMTAAREQQYGDDPAKWVNYKEKHNDKSYLPLEMNMSRDEFFPFNDTRFGYTDQEGSLHPDLAEQLYKREIPKYSVNYEKPILTSADESRWDEFLREQGLSNRTDRNTKESIANEAEKRKADLFELLGPPKAKK